jgi:hypothetical protein
MGLGVRDNGTVLKSRVFGGISSDKTVPPHIGESRCNFGLLSPIYGALAGRNKNLYLEPIDNWASPGNFDAKIG